MRSVSLVLSGLLLFAAAGCDSNTQHRAAKTTCQACLDGTHGSAQAAARAQAAASGLSIVPAVGVTAPNYAGDKGPAQVFEVLRPENTPVTLGRFYMDCTCVRASTDGGKTRFAADERVLITVRQVDDAPEGGATFQLTVQVNKPGQAILTQPVTVGR